MHMLPKRLPAKVVTTLQEWFSASQRVQQSVEASYREYVGAKGEAEMQGLYEEWCASFKAQTLKEANPFFAANMGDALSQLREKRHIRCKGTTIRVPRQALLALLASSQSLENVRGIVEDLPAGSMVVLSRTRRNRSPRRFYIREQTCQGKCERPKPSNDVVGIDEGVRTGWTMVFASGKVVEWGGRRDLHVMERAALQANGIQSAYMQDGITHRRRSRMKKALLRLRLKNRNRRRDLHCKIVRFITENAAAAISGQLSPNILKTKGTHSLSTETVKQWLCWSHPRWRQRLTHQQEVHDHLLYIQDSEAWTTRTCSGCGTVRERFSHKTFKCVDEDCELVLDRDVNAARNILLRALTITNPSATEAWLDQHF